MMQALPETCSILTFGRPICRLCSISPSQTVALGMGTGPARLKELEKFKVELQCKSLGFSGVHLRPVTVEATEIRPESHARIELLRRVSMDPWTMINNG